MTANEIVISIASRALAQGADPGDVAAFLKRVLEPPEQEFARILHEAERLKPISNDDIARMTP